jgi:hypothetical protein
MMNRAVFCLAILCALAATGAFGQQEEVIRALTVTRVTSSVWASARDQWLVFDLPFAGLLTTRNGNYREGIELSLAGSVYHPNLMSYVLASRLGLAQWEGTGASAVAPAQELTANFHVLTNWLQRKPVSFTLYADRRDDFPDADILDRAEVSRSALGGSARWANGFAPLSLSLEKSWAQEQRPSWSSAEEALVLRLGADRTSADQNSLFRADYAFTDFTRALNGAQGQIGQSHDARLFDSLAFGDRGADRLISNLRFLDLAGTISQDTFSLAESLDLELPWNLSGQASYDLTGTWDPSSSALTHQARLAVKHQLFESLTTTVAIHGALTSASSYDQGIIGSDLQVRYKKNIGFGFLHLDYSLDPVYEDWTASARAFSVAGERHVLRDATVTFLDYPCADPSAIVVTDDAGIVAYTAGVDFTVTDVSGRLQLRRLSGGRIPDAAAVLVDYPATSDPSFQRVALSQEAGIRLAFLSDSLTLSYRYKRRRYPFTSGAVAQNLELIDDHKAGLALDFAPLTGSIEFEHSGSSTVPYDSLRMQEGLSWPITPTALLSVQGVQGFVWFAPERVQSFLEVVTRFGLDATQSLSMSVAAGCRLQGDAGSAPPSAAWSAEAGLAFHQGALKLDAGYRFTGPGNVSSLWDHSLFVSMTREL